MGADFTWVDGERLVRFGDGALADSIALLSERGFERYALLATDRALRAAPALEAGAEAVLQVPLGPVATVAAAIRGGVEGRPLVALGGGRVVDTAKAIAAADRLACAAIPTTLAGAELTRRHRLPNGVEGVPRVRPSLVVCDPRLAASQPMPELAASAMNALGHALEALYVPGANPVAEMAALRGAELIAGALGRAEPDREPLALGAMLGGYALGATGLAVHHVVCQTLVGLCETPHAQTNAVMLPHSVRLMERRAPKAIGRFAAALGDGGAPADRAARVAAHAGVTRLSELGVERGRLTDVVAAVVARPELGNTPDPPGGAELLAALERAL